MANPNDKAAFLADFDVSRETLARLDDVIATLDDWRTRSNLIGPKEWPHIWTRHVGDCFQLVAHVGSDARIVDLGSGAGFPGLILAAAQESGHVTMIESVGKKCAFLRAAIEAAALPARVVQGRVESSKAEEVDFVTARAFAPLPKLLEYAAPWLKKGATGLFLKGERWKDELTEALKVWNFAYEAIPSRDGGSGVILVVKELTRVRD